MSVESVGAMNSNDDTVTAEVPETTGEIGRFTDSFASFNRVINSLQRKYIELKDEFSRQNEELASANAKLVQLSERHLSATEFLDRILNSVAAGVIAVDEEGRVTHFNPAASLILGIPQRDPLGRPYRKAIPFAEPEGITAVQAARSGCCVDAAEKRLRLADGTSVVVSVSTSILRDNKGASRGAVEVFQDLTKMQRMEEELARLNTMAALGQMAATVAHEVRNPLGAIAGFAALLRRDLDTDDPRQELISKIVQGTENLNRTVETLLNYARFEELNKRQTDYGGFLQSALDQFCYNQGEDVRDRVLLRQPQDSDPNPVSAVIDAQLMRQAVFNVLTNALEASGNDEPVELSYHLLSRSTATAKYAGKLMLSSNETVLETTITDRGPGVPEDEATNIFAPFFTTKPEGNGLGLAVAWKIMKAHSGEIVAQNRSGGGAVFRLLLPMRMENVNTERSK